MVILFDSRQQRAAAGKSRQQAYGIVEQLGLSDPALFTEASYTRHLSQADRHTAFGSHPSALEHFPTGSIAPPPEHMHP